MKRIALIAVAALVGLGLVPVSAGAQASTGFVTIVHDATYSADAPFPVTLCVDGEIFAGGLTWGDVVGPVELPFGSYEVAIYTGDIDACEGEPFIGPTSVVVGEGTSNITVAAIWTSAGPSLTSWDNVNLCTEAGQGRVTIRHGADTGGPVDVLAIVDGVESTVAAGVFEGASVYTSVPAPLEATDVVIVPAGGTTPIVDLGPFTFPEGVNTVVYAGGGNDGPVGVFVDFIDVGVCETPVEPTTTTTTTAPAAAAPATLTPAFTG
jgi:hypothetical protein